jgi:hypothetical protein
MLGLLNYCVGLKEENNKGVGKTVHGKGLNNFVMCAKNYLGDRKW